MSVTLNQIDRKKTMKQKQILPKVEKERKQERKKERNEDRDREKDR